MKESGPQRSTSEIIGILRSKYTVLKDTQRRSYQTGSDALQQVLPTIPEEERSKVTDVVIPATGMLARTQATVDFLEAMDQLPEITPHLALRILEVKEQIETQREAKEAGEIIATPRRDQEQPEDILERLTAEGTPRQEFIARTEESLSEFLAASDRFNEASADFNSADFNDGQRQKIDTALRYKRIQAELATDSLWHRSLNSHPDIAETTIIEVMDEKRDIRSQFNAQWEIITPDEPEE